MKRLLAAAIAVIFGLGGGVSAQQVTSVPGGNSSLLIGNTLTNSGGVLNTTQPADRPVTGTTDTILSTDLGKFIDYQNASGVAVSVPAASGAGFTQGFSFGAQDQGAGALTLTPT